MKNNSLFLVGVAVAAIALVGGYLLLKVPVPPLGMHEKKCELRKTENRNRTDYPLAGKEYEAINGTKPEKISACYLLNPEVILDALPQGVQESLCQEIAGFLEGNGKKSTTGIKIIPDSLLHKEKGIFFCAAMTAYPDSLLYFHFDDKKRLMEISMIP